VNRVIGNVAQHVGEPSPRIDVVHLGGDDQAVHERRPLTTAIGAGEQPRPTPERDTAQIIVIALASSRLQRAAEAQCPR